MPSFANPFQGNVPKMMNQQELIQALRLDIAGELEAIFLYDAHSQATDNKLAKTVLDSIRDEEQNHVGELLTLLFQLDPNEATKFTEGQGEVNQKLSQLNIKPMG